MITRRDTLRLGLALPLPFLSLSAPAWGQDAQASLDQAGARLDQLHSLQVMRGNDTVFAQAWRGPGLDGVANIKSCSKSLVALLLGCAIDRGEVSGPDATLGEVAPRLIPAGADDRVAQITMGDLASLRAGLEGTSGPNYGGWVASNNWVASALRRDFIAEPGERMIYSTGSTHVLGAALAEATGDSLLTQARDRLGAPMGFQVPAWTRDPQGYYMGGNQMGITPRAMLSIARMLRDGGQLDGTRVIPADWIAQSLEPRARSPFSGMDYGYGWFLTDTGYALARGYGGQVIAAHVEADLAVALTSDPNRPARSGGYFGDVMDLLDGPILALA